MKPLIKSSYTVALVQWLKLKTYIGFNVFRIEMEKFKNNYINYSSLPTKFKYGLNKQTIELLRFND